MKKSFVVHDSRPGLSGGKMLLDVIPKNVASDPHFLNCSIPAESQLSRQAYGYLIVTEGEYFSRFHCDSAETLDSLITLHGAGEKVWFFIKPGPLGRMMEDTYYDSMMACLREHGSQLTCCVQKVGDTIYLPYAWIHCVLTIENVGGYSSLLSLGLRVPRERYEHMWGLIAPRLPVGERRSNALIKVQSLKTSRD